ncbi:MAG TPA: hypothetical protein VF486_13325 [Actinomycetes bacterium]
MPEISTRSLGEREYEVGTTVEGASHAWRVRVPEELTARLGADPAEVARATIAFLLEREPPGSIMASFDCAVVRRYFPEYDAELPGYLQG